MHYWTREPRNLNSYYLATAAPAPARPSCSADFDCDVCIIGGGMTGVSAALHLARAGFQVVVLEARDIGWGASGRNGGWITPYMNYDLRVLRTLDHATAKAYCSLATSALDRFYSLLEADRIECDLKRGSLQTARSPQEFARTRANAVTLANEFGMTHLQVVEPSVMAAWLGTDRYCGGIFDSRIALVHPLKLVRGVAAAAEQAGAMLFERTEVRDVQGGQTVDVRVATGHRIRAKHVLYACNAYRRLASSLDARLIPVYTAMGATDVLPEALARSMFPRDVAVLDDAAITYYRLSSDRRLLFGVGAPFVSRDCIRAGRQMRDSVAETFPQLRDVGIEYAWGGWLAFNPFGDTADIGQLAPNIYYAQAIPMLWATFHGQLLADHLRGTSTDYRALADIAIPSLPGGRHVAVSLQRGAELLAWGKTALGY